MNYPSALLLTAERRNINESCYLAIGSEVKQLKKGDRVVVSSIISCTINRFLERLQLARDFGKAEIVNYEEVDAGEALKEMTGGRGSDACIDAVGTKCSNTKKTTASKFCSNHKTGVLL